MPVHSAGAEEQPPRELESYVRWLKLHHKLDAFDAGRAHYNAVSERIRSHVAASTFWKDLCSQLGDFDAAYRLETGYPLLWSIDPPELLLKTYDSFLLKTLRKNVLDNRRWPDPPSDGWLLPPAWHTRVSDIIRTSLVVKYLDGVGFLASRIAEIAKRAAAVCKVLFEAREEGYYAAHLYVTFAVDTPTLTWSSERINATLEIQITTQLQEVIRRLTHTYYEQRRLRPREEPATKWQWDYKSEVFVANYLGHILHYIEGMIMELREKQKEAR